MRCPGIETQRAPDPRRDHGHARGAAGPPRLVLVGYSKGAPDILEAVVRYPESAARRRGRERSRRRAGVRTGQ